MKNPAPTILILGILCNTPAPVLAGDAVEASLQALGYSIEAGFKMVSAAAAIPLVTVGEIGKVSGEIGAEFIKEAETPPGQGRADRAFPLTDEVVTAGPNPAEELEKNR